MGLDRERILAKVAFVREQLQAIRDLARTRSKEAIIYDQWVLKGLKYSLQTAIEAMIDITYHISAAYFRCKHCNGAGKWEVASPLMLFGILGGLLAGKQSV